MGAMLYCGEAIQNSRSAADTVNMGDLPGEIPGYFKEEEMDKPTYEEMESIRITNKKDALKYLNKDIWYLTNDDIDHSGRGYYFVRFMHISDIYRGNFADEHYNYLEYKKIVKIKECV